MGILNKFENIEIDSTLNISEVDKEFCEEQEQQYKQFIDFSNKYLQYLDDNKFNNLYFSSQNLIDEMKNEQINKAKSFVNKIVNYFRNTYKVTLTSETINKVNNLDINYNVIVSEIIEQLNGYNFLEKAEKEIKDSFKDCIKWDNVKVKNNKISIESFFSIDSWDAKYKKYSVSYCSDEKFYKLFKAISYFLFKSKECYFNNLYDIITREQGDEVFKVHTINNIGIETLKLYKNGKIDLVFSNTEYTMKFVKEYCEK